MKAMEEKYTPAIKPEDVAKILGLLGGAGDFAQGLNFEVRLVE